MDANAAISGRSSKQRLRLLVRMNATLFHCIGAAVLLESARVAAVQRDAVASGARSGVEEARERALWLREYARSVWPEYAWDAACAAMRLHVTPRIPGQYVPGLPLLGREAAGFYRAMARVVEDGELRSQLAALAATAMNGSATRDGDGRDDRGTPIRRMLTARMRLASLPGLLHCFFERLRQHWCETPPFPISGYADTVARARAVLVPHLGLGWHERVIVAACLHPAHTARRATVCDVGVTKAAAGVRFTSSAGASALPPLVLLR